MDNDLKRPSAALINRDWFTAAADVLPRQDLAEVVLRAVEYVFSIDPGCKPSAQVGLVFAMVKPSLDSDIIKYTERCARNAANAKSQRQRVGASGSESQRVGANTTTTTTTTPTTTTTTTSSLSPELIEERDRWLVFGLFWYTGSKAIKEEFNAFWNYYESLGWKNNKGAPIVSRIACARQWNRRFETGAAPDGAPDWFQAVKSCSIYDYGVWKCYAGMERKEDRVIVRLRCTANYLKELQTAVPNLDRDLRTIWRTAAIDFETAG